MTPRIVQAANGTHLTGYLNPGGIVSVGDYCTECGRDTNAGSGAWVNRIPSGATSADGTTEIVGYMCSDCQAMECDRCGEQTIEYSAAPSGYGFWCDDCHNSAAEHEAGRARRAEVLSGEACAHCTGEGFADYGATCEEPCRECDGTGKGGAA